MEENLFRSIPRVDELLGRDELKVSALPPVLLRESVREELDALRDEVRGGLSALPETGILCARILARAEEKQLPTLCSVINATGVTLHTNLGRACLSERAANAAAEAARDYSTLEYDVENGCRGSRYQHVEALLCRLILRIGPRFPLIDSNRAQYRFPLQLASISCRSSSLWIRSRMVRGFPNMESPLMGNSPATDSSSSSSSTCAPWRMYIMASLHIALAFSAPDCSLPLKTGVAFQEMCPVYRYFYRFSAYVFQKGRFRPRNAYVFSAFGC